MFRVYQHWDPLRTCVVGRSYPPEFYDWITVPRVRELFERIAIETEQDFQNIIQCLERFNVKILRPDLPTETFRKGQYVKPPMCPRDSMVMVGDVFYEIFSTNFRKPVYDEIKDPTWPACYSWEDFDQLDPGIQNECREVFNFGYAQPRSPEYDRIFSVIKQQGNQIKSGHSYVNGAGLTRIGKDLYFGTEHYGQDVLKLKHQMDQEFPSYRNHVVNTGGHSDATFCAVAPGLIISLCDVPTYADTFPGWEVLYLKHEGWEKVHDFLELKRKNAGRWWLPGFERDQQVIDTVETWLNHWVGFVEETIFDINMLIIDPKNVMVFNDNAMVHNTLKRFDINMHVVPFRHRYFWDGGIHCVTTDLDRDSVMQDWFPGR